MRSNGGLIGPKKTVSTSAASGIWATRDAQREKGALNWPGSPGFTEGNPATSPADLRLNGITTDGDYYINSSANGQTATRLVPVRFNYHDGRDWVIAYQSVYNTSPSIEHLGYSIPWKGLLVEQGDGTKQTAYFSAFRPYNQTNSTTTATSGTKSGYRVYLGLAGGHGIYNTGQSPCSWSECSGMSGSIYDGDCGTYSSNPQLGVCGGAPFGNVVTGTWKFLIWMDNA